MATYLEYKLTDGSTILIEAPQDTGGPVKASATGDAFKEAEKVFEEALSSVKNAALTLQREFIDLQTDEVEVSFGIKAAGEASIFAVCKVAGEANFNIKLKWKRPQTAQ